MKANRYTSEPATSASISTASPSSSSPYPSPELRHFSPSTSSSAATTSLSSSSAAEEPPTLSYRDGGGQDPVAVERRTDYSALCRWTVIGFHKVKARALWSRYFEVGGFDCRLLIYPKGDSQALPGYLSVYLQIIDPRGSSSGSSNRWDCFASYRLSITNHLDESKSVHRDSWHRFSSKKRSHGWCDFAPASSVLDPKAGFLVNPGESLVITADILILDESVSFSRVEGVGGGGTSNGVDAQVLNVPTTDVLSGKFTWKVRNFSLFKEMIKTQKIMSPVFPAGECNLRISVYQSSVSGVEHLSMCLESKDTDKTTLTQDRSCWCLFRMSILSQRSASTVGTSPANHVHRDSYGRFAADNKSGDNTSLGWNDFMRLADFIRPDSGYLVDDTVVFTVSFHVIKESSGFSKNAAPVFGGRGYSGVGGPKKADGHFGKFTWRIENFTRLKDLLKKRKITGLCVKSKRFQIGNRDCRLIVYPRGQSQPPCHLSMFLEVTDSRNTSTDWSCFVSHRLSVVNQKSEEKSVMKESQNRYSKSAKDWGWREFITLTSLFDQDSGFLVQDTVVFSAEVLILKETSTVQEITNQAPEPYGFASSYKIGTSSKRLSFTWRVENFLSFKEIMETRKIFSKFFQAGGCELRIGVYESFDTICIYLESDQSTGSDPEKNFWVRYRMAMVNQRNLVKTIWKESSICTKTWNNSVLQFMKVSDLLEADGGFVVRDTVVFVCEILDCCPWFDFNDLEVLASEAEQDCVSTDPDELIDSEDSGISGDEEDMFRNLLSRAGFRLTYNDNSLQPQVTLREKLLMDAGAIAGFLSGLRVYLDDPAKVKRLLLPTSLPPSSFEKNDATRSDTNSPSLMNLLMGVKVLQQAIVDLLLDIMVECCQPSDRDTGNGFPDLSCKHVSGSEGATAPESSEYSVKSEDMQCSVFHRLDTGNGEECSSNAVQSSEMNGDSLCRKINVGHITPPETSAGDLCADDRYARSKPRWPEQSEELLGLIVNSLRTLDNAVPQGCPEPRRKPQSIQKIALLLEKAPKHIQPDLISLVPKLIDHSEHYLAASMLLDFLQKPDVGPASWSPVFSSLNQLELGSEAWERVLGYSLELLSESNNELLVEVISFVLKAAAHCQNLPKAVRVIRSKLKTLGLDVPQCVLDMLSKTVNTWTDVAETMLKDVDLDGEVHETCNTIPCGQFDYSSDVLSAGEVQVLHGCQRISDVYILLEMLSNPCLFVDVSQVFERAIARGAIGLPLFAMILDRRHSKHASLISPSTAGVHDKEGSVDRKSEPMLVQADDFTSVLALIEVLSLSREPRVLEFVRLLYTIMFRIYNDEHFRERMLKGLVDRVTCSSDSRLIEMNMDVLTFLIREEDGITRPVLNMMREVAELAHVERAALWHQLCAMEDETIRIREERQSEASCFSQEKEVLSQNLNDLEATVNCLKAELKSQTEHFIQEKKELSEKILEVENQLEWIRSERDDKIAKLSAEKRLLQEHVHDAEKQISHMKSRRRDELKKVAKEKNALAERLKNAEAARKRFDDELKRYADETLNREEVRLSLEDEVRRLTQTVGQTEGEKREKEKQVAQYEECINTVEAQLQTCQQYIRNLEISLQEEMSRHAPIYGVGLEALSLEELETVTRIHEEGLRQIHAEKQRRGSGNSLVSGHSIPLSSGLFCTDTQPVAVLPQAIIPNGGHSKEQVISTMKAGQWFNPS